MNKLLPILLILFMFIAGRSTVTGQSIDLIISQAGNTYTVFAETEDGSDFSCFKSADVYILIPPGADLVSVNPLVANAILPTRFVEALNGADLFAFNMSKSTPTTPLPTPSDNIALFSFQIDCGATEGDVRLFDPFLISSMGNPESGKPYISAISASNDCGRITNGSFSLDVSGGGFACGSAAPVELIHFTAEARNDQTTLLSWQTATELNNDFFQVEHSTDELNFQAIGKVKGAGTTEETQDYDFLHRSPQVGANYYRLKQVDFDGTSAYSDVEIVHFDEDGRGTVIFKAYPNPTSRYLTIRPPGGKEVLWQLDVFNTLGQLISSISIQNDQYRLDTTRWSSGVYQLQLYSGDRKEGFQFVKH